MSGTLDKLGSILTNMGSDVTIHREDGGTPCPCLTPEGFRDPTWHIANPDEPVCNEQGYLTTATELTVKASIQPALTAYSRYGQRSNNLLGEVQRDDKVGIFPCSWEGNEIDFSGWSDAGEDYVVYDGDRYLVVAADKVPDVDGNPSHHYECGLRLLTAARPSA